ncbi:MAG TPA: class I SAM-dependent methyltransferase [Dyella sp.]|uniref:class I SAM-dependent methyltransferase n=1 Tax=Dyella sp. TaxID=1869338 RepID=UPI002D7A2ECC|nr:class I SAM-dependent methyltransferase [Dyella sp.]HET6553601.1 class I SAM-dependent methyltransferase [Dyella sp.]
MPSTKAYRQRIYGSYVSAQDDPPPATAADFSASARYLRRIVARHLPADREATVLDLGCGHGTLLHFLKQAGYRNIGGVDGSMEQVALAARLGVDNVVHGDLFGTLAEQPDASLDVVVAFDVLEHLERDEALALVDAVRRTLKPGGRFLIHTPNAESPFFGRIRYGDLTHEMAYTRTSLAQLFGASGFGPVACFEDVPAPGSLKGTLRFCLWKLLRLALRLCLAVETGDTGARAIFSQNLLCVAYKPEARA